jgi:hypothetical protein
VRGTRISVLAVLALVVSLLGASPASAADPSGTVALFTAGSGGTPLEVFPVTRTAAGLVWRQAGDPEMWLRSPQGWWLRKTRLTDPQSAGDLLSHYDSSAHTFVYETIGADRTDRAVDVPADLTYLVSTSTGYLAQRGTGPYELVSVDVLNGTDPVVFGTTTVAQTSLRTSPLGALAQTDVAGQYLYFPYATPGTGQVLQTPPNSTCTLTSIRLYCSWSDGTTNHLTRLPLTGEAGDQIAVTAFTVVEIPDGIAFTWANGTVIELSTWALTDPAPTPLLDGNYEITRTIAAATDDPSTVLVSHPGPFWQAGIFAVHVGGGGPTLQMSTRWTEPRKATDVAISPGQVAWADNGYYHGAVSVADLTGTMPRAERLMATTAVGATLSIAGARLTYTSGLTASGPSKLNDAGTVQQLDDGGVLSQLSGDRLLMQSRVGGPGPVGTAWALKDLRSGQTTALPDALSYHLWGDRLARLDADGSIWVLDLRSGAAPEQVRAPSADVSDGTVQLAGDTVAWEITSSGGSSSTTEVMTRNLAMMASAAPVPGLTQLAGLSTGYAIGSVCPAGGSCRTAAVSLADGSATTFDAPPSGTGHSVAVDGNTLAFVSASGIASVFALPAYADQPRLLGSPAARPTASGTQAWTARIVTSRVLTTCQIEIRDAAHTLVRAVSCLDPHAATTVTWDGKNTAGVLVADGAYTWRIVGAADGIPLADYDGSTAALSGPITVLPAVTAHSPGTNSNSASQTTNVTATFSAPVTGVSTATFMLRGPAGATVPAVVSYNALTRTATLDPTATVAADARYTATVTGGTTAIRDGAKRPLTTQSWSFITGPAPRVLAESPWDGTGPAVSTNVTATFSEAVQGIGATTFTLWDYAHNQAVPAAVTYNATTRVATLNPAADLTPDSLYMATLTGGTTAIRDGIGNPLAYRSWTFHSGPAPAVTARTPGSNVTGVAINGNITATFSEPVQGIGPYTVVLTNPAGTKIPALVTYNATNRTVTLNPTASLARLVKYRVTIVGAGAGIADMALNALPTTSWTFTTGIR